MRAAAPDLSGPRSSAPRVGEALRALMLAQCRQVDRALNQARARHAGIHRARKGFRTLRAMLALRGKKAAAAASIDQRLRRLARSLSALRDAQVAAQTAETLAADSAPWLPAAQALRAACEQSLATALAADPKFAARRRQLARAREAIDALPWSKISAKTCSVGLHRSRKRTGRSEARARRRRTLELLHAWRRRLRRQRLQMDALAGLAKMSPAVPLPAHRHRDTRRLRRLSDALGHRQDLRLLRRHLARIDPSRLRGPLRVPLRKALAEADAALALRH